MRTINRAEYLALRQVPKHTYICIHAKGSNDPFYKEAYNRIRPLQNRHSGQNFYLVNHGINVDRVVEKALKGFKTPCVEAFNVREYDHIPISLRDVWHNIDDLLGGKYGQIRDLDDNEYKKGKRAVKVGSYKRTALHDEVDKHRVKITSSKLKRLVSDNSGFTAHKFDRTYYAIPWSVWQKVIKETAVNEHNYVSDVFDCDDFGKLFSALVAAYYNINTAGWVIDYSGRHSYNCLICDDNNGKGPYIKWFEPQNDRTVFKGEKKSNSEMYKFENGIVIF